MPQEMMLNLSTKSPLKDLLIVMGHLNAVVGSVNVGNKRVLGRRGYDNLNDNGESLVDLCGIGGTLFSHEDIHKIYWYSSNRLDKSQIDHHLINGKWKRFLQDVCVGLGRLGWE